MRDILFFPFLPGRLGQRDRVSATRNNIRDFVAEPGANISDSPQPSGVFTGIVQQCGYCFIFIRIMFERDGCHTENVRDIWNASSFP